MKKYDIAVIGGGFAGVAAAVSASRLGASVLIVERNNSFGGASSYCLVNPFMPYSTKINGEEVPLSQGIFKEIVTELKKRGACDGYSFLEEELKLLLNEMIEKENIDTLFHANVCSVKRDGGRVLSASVITVGGIIEIEADYFIDATGDAQLAFLGGFPTVTGRESDMLCQPMTLCFRLGNVDTDRFFESWDALSRAHRRALESGEIINPRENILVFKMLQEGVLHFNTTRVVKLNPTDPHDLTKAEFLGRKQVFEIYELMKKHAQGLEKSYLMMTAAHIGVRESRQIVGEYTLLEKDLRSFRKFEDSIAACNYDIDIHNPEGSGTSHYYFPVGEYYTIPYRSLVLKGAHNILASGRCISSDHASQASYRIMPTVCAIGEASGTAAAIAAKRGVAIGEIDIKELQSTLKAQGAFIGI